MTTVTQEDRARLLAAEAERGAALVARDGGRLEILFDDDLVHVHSTGEVMTKAEIIAYVTGTLRFLSVERGELTLRAIGGDAALMVGPMATRMSPDAAPERVIDSQAIVTQLWVRQGGAWRQAAFQSTRAG